MSSNGVVSILVEALGVSITIADGSIAIEQTKTEIPAPAAATSRTVPASTVITERVPSLLKGIDGSTVRRDSGAKTSVIDDLNSSLMNLNGRLINHRHGAGMALPYEGRSLYRHLLEVRYGSAPIPVRTKRPGLAKQNRYGAMKKLRS